MSNCGLFEGPLTHSVIGCFYDVYNYFGGGLPEHIYVRALGRELRSRGHRVAREVPVTVFYKSEELATLRLDMVVDDRLVIEAKATDGLPPTALRQLHDYLRCTPYEVGMLLHFGPAPKFYPLVCPNSRTRGRGA
jgi:GxxExxY protein